LGVSHSTNINTQQHNNHTKTNTIMKKYYFESELVTAERSRYWNNFLDGALVSAFLCLAAVVILVALKPATTPNPAPTTEPEVRLNVPLREPSMQPRLHEVTRFEF
jgi:hypothetical protein